MNVHDKIDEIAPEFVTGRLDAETARHVELHLATCADCAALTATLSDLSSGFRIGGSSLLTPHPDPLALADFAGDRTADSTIQRHLETCASCQLEVEAHRASAPAAKILPFAPRPRDVAARGRLFTVPASLAAGLVVGVGLTLLYRPLPEPGASKDPAAATWSGPVQLALLERPLRGDAPVPSFDVAPGQPYVPLAVPVALPETATGTELYRVSVRAEGISESSWSVEIQAGEVRSQIARTGVATFLVPAEALGAGRHSVEVVPASGGETILEIVFDVRGR